ncbi:MAG: hypothetical protein O3A39_06390 [Proteobacteria bacterium]|jgi:hypothetical protein|nr:hypothetical protein [Pseudomonadota bacterium]
MKTKIILTLLSVMTTLSVFSQQDKAFFELNQDSQIDITATSDGTYKTIKVKVSNFGSETMNVHFLEGGVFVNLDETEQNLVVLFYEKLVVAAGQTEEVVIATACANPKRKVPTKNRTTWKYDYDKKVGDLIRYYNENRGMVEMMTGAEHHDTFEKRHNFLQMCVWIYYNADKKQILDFATKYMFEGNREQATLFVEAFYPMAVSFINIYKSM